MSVGEARPRAREPSEAEEGLDLLPGIQAERGGESEQREQDDQEPGRRAASCTIAFRARAPLRPLQPVRALHRGRIQRRGR